MDLSGRGNVGGSVADEAGTRLGAELARDIVEGIAKNSGAGLTAIAEEAKGEIRAQASSFNLVPANRFQIPGGQTNQFSGLAKMFEYLRNTRANSGHNLLVICLHFAADNFKSFGEGGFKCAVLNAFARQRSPQD